MNPYNDLALLTACDSCKARPGEWCRTFRPTRRPAGARTTWLHGARLHPIYQAYGMGCQDGELGGMEAALEDPQAARVAVERRRKETARV